MHNSAVNKITKAIKNSALVFFIAKQHIFKYIYPNISAIPTRCEGLISSPEAVLLYRGARNNKKNGPILDFGSFKGLSTSILSRAASAQDRIVYSFESFEGLPDTNELDKAYFSKGDYKARKEDFLANVEKCGNIDRVNLLVGDCCNILKVKIINREIRNFSFAFIDVDLYDSIKKILLELDKIATGGERIIIHDYHSLGVKTAIAEFAGITNHKILISELPSFPLMVKIDFKK